MSTTAIGETATAPVDASAIQRRRVGWSAFIGTTVEYYDFTLYALLGPTVFDRLFFPKTDPIVGTVLVLAVFAVGFVGRPVGGIFFSHFGDRVGRKPMMIITMSVMGLASTAMGLLPTYPAVGALAPIMLVTLRIFQGFALGGETAAANVMTTEYGRAGRRGVFVSLSTAGTYLAWLLAVGASTLVSLLPADDFLAWGWRIPFVISIVLVGVGLYVRLKIEESPVFLRAIKIQAPARVPFLELMRVAKKSTLIVLFAGATESTSGFFFIVFGYTYAIRTLHIPAPTMLLTLLASMPVALALTPIMGALSDRFGRRTILRLGYLIQTLFGALFFFPMISSGNLYLLFAAMIFTNAVSTMSLGVVGSFYSEQFKDARLRYSGVGFGRGLGTSLGGGLTPLVAASLMAAWGGGTIGPILWFVAVMAGGLIAITIARETNKEGLN
jgi:MFS family permease